MSACVHLLGERGWSRCGKLANSEPCVVEDYDAVTCGLCLRFEPRSPLVCVCPDTKANPARNWGECPDCRRKPRALMAVGS